MVSTPLHSCLPNANALPPQTSKETCYHPLPPPASPCDVADLENCAKVAWFKGLVQNSSPLCIWGSVKAEQRSVGSNSFLQVYPWFSFFFSLSSFFSLFSFLFFFFFCFFFPRKTLRVGNSRGRVTFMKGLLRYGFCLGRRVIAHK